MLNIAYGNTGPLTRTALLGFLVRLLLVLIVLPEAVRADGGQARRNVLSLDGTWSVEEGVAPRLSRRGTRRTVAVPGLTNQARPVFPDVDDYETHEYVYTMKRYGVLPPSENVRRPRPNEANSQLLLVRANVQGTGPARSCHARGQQGPVRHSGVAQWQESRRASGLLHRRPVRRDDRIELGRRQPPGDPHRCTPGRHARLGFLGQRRRERPLDARHL